MLDFSVPYESSNRVLLLSYGRQQRAPAIACTVLSFEVISFGISIVHTSFSKNYVLFIILFI